MITGYNTDVKRNDIDFHVQTEDKGTSNPFIESLIYVGGQVLAAKRTSYAEVLAEGRGSKAILGLMDQQHRAMIMAIRKGKFDAKVRSLLDGSVPAVVGGEVADPGSSVAEDRTLDEVILEYLTTEAQQEHLVLMLDEEVELTFGQETVMRLRTSSSKSSLPVVGAEVTVKMISTAHDPRVLAAGETDDGGFLALQLQIPATVQGTCALIITANSTLGKAELKYLL